MHPEKHLVAVQEGCWVLEVLLRVGRRFAQILLVLHRSVTRKEPHQWVIILSLPYPLNIILFRSHSKLEIESVLPDKHIPLAHSLIIIARQPVHIDHQTTIIRRHSLGSVQKNYHLSYHKKSYLLVAILLVNETAGGIGISIDLVFGLVYPLIIWTVTNFPFRDQVSISVMQKLVFFVDDVRGHVQEVVGVGVCRGCENQFVLYNRWIRLKERQRNINLWSVKQHPVIVAKLHHLHALPPRIDHSQLSIIGHYINAWLDSLCLVDLLVILSPIYSLPTLRVVGRELDWELKMILPKFIQNLVVLLHCHLNALPIVELALLFIFMKVSFVRGEVLAF